MSDHKMRKLIGFAAIIGPGLHLLSDIMEVWSGEFSDAQLSINYVAFLIIPYMILGLHSIQRKRGEWMSFWGAVLYGFSFIFFAGTTLFALFQSTSDYSRLWEELGLIYTAHGILMIVGGLMFSISVIRARVFPQMMGFILLFGLCINLLVGVLGTAEIFQIVGSTFRNIAFISMGFALFLHPKFKEFPVTENAES